LTLLSSVSGPTDLIDGGAIGSKVEVLDSITQIEHPDDAVSVWPVHVMRGTKGQP
jgi:ammonia channel protein AmtB